MSEARKSYDNITRLLMEHHRLFRRAIPLIASENVPSPAVREALTTDFGNRYAEGWPGERIYAGCSFIDQVELICIDLAKRLFDAEFVDVRPISGVTANLAVYTAFTNYNDIMFALSIPCGGHISMGRQAFGGTAGSVKGLQVEYFPYDYDELNIDVDETKKKIDELVKGNKAPKLAMFGGSVLPFPHPVKELAEAFQNCGAKVAYDAAHVSGLIAGKAFQDPLREGADAVTMSTHKTLPGPQHGMVVSWNKYSEQIKRAIFPGLVSNHHLHAVAGVAIALAEMLEFGNEYAQQIVRNSKTLGQALHEKGFTVLGEKKGFTQSHLIWVDISKYGDGGTLEAELEKANLIVNRNLLPWDIKMGRHYTNPGGIRLGTSEVTRLGMGEREMTDIAEYIKRVIIDKESSEKIGLDVAEFRKEFQKVHYCFENATEAYEYVKIR
ncbi:MAG: glycine hydroxymethyltransferase [Thermoproteota archaeon]|nr:glycine hydroxymethyltransferase [Thermoproteota archaeon]